MANYVNATEVRTTLALPSGEYTDARIDSLASGATAEIEERTNRFWGGEATTSAEFYNGNGDRRLRLNRMDIHNLISLAIDDDDDQTYTTVTPSTVEIMPEGIIRLTDSSEIAVFTSGFKTVSMSYTHGVLASGNVAPDNVPQDIKRLTYLIISNTLEPNDRQSKDIDREIRRLKDTGAALA